MHNQNAWSIRSGLFLLHDHQPRVLRSFRIHAHHDRSMGGIARQQSLRVRWGWRRLAAETAGIPHAVDVVRISYDGLMAPASLVASRFPALFLNDSRLNRPMRASAIAQKSPKAWHDVRRAAPQIQDGEYQQRQKSILQSEQHYSGRIAMTAIMRPVLPNSARWEKKRVVSQAVQPSTTLICSSRRPASSSWRRLASTRSR